MSISAKDRNLLDKILGEISVITEITANNDEDSFLDDPVLQRATVMSLLNIGELAAHLNTELRVEWNGIPWGKIIGLRNLAAHGYFILSMLDIWKTVTNDIPVLEENTSLILSSSASKPESQKTVSP